MRQTPVVRRTPLRRQRGVALLTVLLLVAVMTVLVMSMLDDIRFGLRRTGNAQAIAQAQWYALGAETLALTRIAELSRRDPGRTTLRGNWNGTPFVFPLEHGAIRARLSDATTCFNLNSVVEGAPEQWQRRELGARQFNALLRALDLPPHQTTALTDALVDWIDSDQATGAAGAEDMHYGLGAPAYRTAGHLLAEPSELRAIAGFDPPTYARLRPHVCALPTATLSPINLNTLQDDDAVLLAMLTDGAVGNEAARRVLRSRPAGGWPDLDTFWSHPAMAAAALPPEWAGDIHQQVALDTRYFTLQAEVEHAGAQVVLSALLEHSTSAEPGLVARRWTPLE